MQATAWRRIRGWRPPRSFKGLVLPDLANNQRLLGGGRPALLASAGAIGEVMHREGLLPGPAALDGLLRADFLPEAGNGG